MRNTLYYGDNLGVMRLHLKDESVDLVYLDPPFNSNQDYNVLFKGKDGTDAAAQIKAFGDTWTWNRDTRLQFEEMVQQGGKVGELLDAFQKFLGTNDMMAYLTMMALRLVELRRVMSPTASIYLHCDPTASHYLKLLMDAVFGPACFQNEIVWQRTSARSDSHRWNHIHDTLLFYSKSPSFTWHTQYMPYDETYLDKFYRNVEAGTGRRFALDNLTAGPIGRKTRLSNAEARSAPRTHYQSVVERRRRRPRSVLRLRHRRRRRTAAEPQMDWHRRHHAGNRRNQAATFGCVQAGCTPGL